MKQPLFIFPFNGNGLEALDCIDNSRFQFIGFIDDTPEKQGMHDMGFTVFSRDILKEYFDFRIIAVPGSPSSFMVRDQIINSLQLDDHYFTTLIHPKASISPLAKIGNNVLIMSGVVLTANVIIEDHVCILPNTVVHHDSTIGKYTLIGSNCTVAGYTKIGSYCYIGSGSSIINNITVGSNCLIGMGTNVIKDVAHHSKVVGNPARALTS
jgi:sugar O-acyltransferase (sialic acid O-acetyltransferase NeuD family)